MDVVLLLVIQKILEYFFIFLRVIIVSYQILIGSLHLRQQVLILTTRRLSRVHHNLPQAYAFQLKTATAITKCSLNFFFYSLNQSLVIIDIDNAALEIPDLLIDAVDVFHLTHLFLLVHAVYCQRVDLRSHFEYALYKLWKNFG